MDFYRDMVIDFFIHDGSLDAQCEVGIAMFIRDLTARYTRLDSEELKEHYCKMKTRISAEESVCI